MWAVFPLAAPVHKTHQAVRKRVKGLFGKTRGSCPDLCLGAPYNIFDPSFRDEVRVPEKACIVISVKQIDVLISKSLGRCFVCRTILCKR
jgi:hypothetical protein